MDLLTQLNCAVEYIEEHIFDDLEISDVSKVTLYSPYHFGRLFYYIADISLSEYIRKRKLSRAGIEVQSSDIKVIDLALKYGYDSSDSFTRAFAKQHNVTPTIARQKDVFLKIFPPLTFQIKIKGVKEMNWRIEEKEAFEVFGVERIFGNDEVALVPDFWTELRENGEYDRLYDVAGIVTTVPGMHSINAVCGYNVVEGDRFPYMVCAFKNDKFNVEGFNVVQIPKTIWAVFRSEEHEIMGGSMKELFDRAYQEWLPSSEYEWMATPDMEMYYTTENGKYIEEAWIPVKRK